MSVYNSIIKGLNEAIDFEQGNITARVSKCTVNPVPDYDATEIRDLRKSLGMTQLTFAEVTGVSQKTVEAWEAGTNKPNGSARRLLGLIQIDPSILSKIKV